MQAQPGPREPSGRTGEIQDCATGERNNRINHEDRKEKKSYYHMNQGERQLTFSLAHSYAFMNGSAGNLTMNNITRSEKNDYWKDRGKEPLLHTSEAACVCCNSFSQKNLIQPSVSAHIFNPSTRESEAIRSL